MNQSKLSELCESRIATQTISSVMLDFGSEKIQIRFGREKRFFSQFVILLVWKVMRSFS